MASDAEHKPGIPTDDIQSDVGEDLDLDLSDGNEDANNEPISVETNVINSTWFKKLLQTMHIL